MDEPTLPRRLNRLPRAEIPDLARQLPGREIRRAAGPLARLLGLAGLLLPRTRAVHTFGMRFALDLVWLDRDGAVVRVDRDVPPRRQRSCRAARAVVELPAGRAPGAGLSRAAPRSR